ncbi:hypothetical protein ALC56_13977 [Trachymyrmex septentrionalis]|uniref:Uncharacterized protein n=1 Tax=Trachymyrmex septentrionalis TaxID=34720 RepID=A0A195EUB3_9HYME|nr:hypothetical protein ALC56_13977 [Trachymyrmex septentrionalis]
MIITWVITISIWLIKKLLHLVNVGYKKLQQKLIVPSSVETMRSEKETLHIMSKRMTRLSEDVKQMRINTETILNALTTKMNIFRETIKMTEDNMAMLLELEKKLRETLQEIRLKSSQQDPLPFSCSFSRSPPSPSFSPSPPSLSPSPTPPPFPLPPPLPLIPSSKFLPPPPLPPPPHSKF